MKIQNLGPVNDADITMNDLTVFIGDNGTGKTLTSYVLYTFVKWFITKYTATLMTNADVEQLVLQREALAKPLTELTTAAAKQFNHLSPDDRRTLFTETFGDTPLIEGQHTTITVTSQDIEAMMQCQLTEKSFSISWDYSANLVAKEGTVRTDWTNRIRYHLDRQQNLVFDYLITDKQGNQLAAVDSHNEISVITSDTISQFLNQNIKSRLYATNYVYLPAERIGINTFRNEISTRRANETFSTNPPITDDSDNSNEQSGLSQTRIAHYPMAIEDYIKFLNTNIASEHQSRPAIDVASFSKAYPELVPGDFSVDTTSREISYSIDGAKIPFNLVSSSLKSLFGLDLFFKNIGAHDYLFIDEPEMNLHPKRQKMIIELLYQLITQGLKIVISTHSDYLVKALINLMLADKLATRPAYQHVSVYDFNNQQIHRIDDILTADMGNFDTTTNEINRTYYDLLDQRDNADTGDA
ncbi:AAA family ATPase [Lactiplantibacillus pentosus]|uniref:AAA family ATPase n=1 Tax=Lactiplantibacillus pentosus TaxID=1589 RepID=UPI002079AFE2|nr:AAA family ATPase [Lactiplantibacillus pentosus]USJ87353.1 ATP-binding protein [Lactiplantibacillus pentosus]